jgi:hypothetical protein
MSPDIEISNKEGNQDKELHLHRGFKTQPEMFQISQGLLNFQYHLILGTYAYAYLLNNITYNAYRLGHQMGWI